VIKGFRDFVLRGNIVELAIAFVLGVAFAQVVDAFATDFIGGLIGALIGQPNLDSLGFDVGSGRVVIGTTLTALLNFLLVAALIYFLIVVPLGKLMAARRTAEKDFEAPVRECPECLSSIPVGAARCAFCTASVQPVAR
jgi:large conductance mechanosensitive channel